MFTVRELLVKQLLEMASSDKDLKKLLEAAKLTLPETEDKREIVDFYLANTTENTQPGGHAIELNATVEDLAKLLKLSANALQTFKDEEFQTMEDVRILADAANFPDNLVFKRADKLKLAKFLRPNYLALPEGKKTADQRCLLNNKIVREGDNEEENDMDCITQRKKLCGQHHQPGKITWGINLG